MDRATWLFTRVVLSAIGALATQGVNAQTTQDVTVCAGPRSAVTADDRIAACTRVITSGQWRDKALGWAYNGRCLAQYDKRAWDEALLDCSMAIKLNPKDPYAYFNRGDTWGAKSDNNKAIADYGEAIRLDPKFAYAFNNRGNAWETKGDNDKAIADYDEAIRLDPKFPYAFNNRGGAWRGQR